MDLYILSNYPEIDMDRKRPMLLVCPGGGYEFTSDREGEPIAVKFMSYGYNAAVLYYTTTNKYQKSRKLYPLPQKQLAKAVAYIRKNAESLNTDPDKICIIGFSAGGHLVASHGCFWQKYGEKSKPNAQILCYPVITSGEYAHRGSFDCLCKNNKKLVQKLSLENCANAQVPPTFIWHTKTDQTVPVENTKMFVEALKQYDIPVEVHFFADGSHGLSLATTEVLSRKKPETNANVAKWVELAHKWMDTQFDVHYCS